MYVCMYMYVYLRTVCITGGIAKWVSTELRYLISYRICTVRMCMYVWMYVCIVQFNCLNYSSLYAGIPINGQSKIFGVTKRMLWDTMRMYVHACN